MTLQSWATVIVDSFRLAWERIAGFLPDLVGAIIVFVIGLIVASGLGRLAERIVDALKVDNALEKAGVRTFFDRGGLALDSGRFVGELVRWFFIIVFVLATADILQLQAVTDFLTQVLLYLPKLIVAVLILLAAVLVANFIKGLVRASVTAAKLQAANFLASLSWWAIITFAFIAALDQLGIRFASTLFQTLLTGLVAMLAIAGGLAFGLGGRDAAAAFLERIRQQIRER